MVTAEPFFLWIIEGDKLLKEKLPFHLTELDVKIVTDMQPYRTRKVRILNGAHTAMVPLSLLYGLETVSQIFSDDFTDHVLKKVVLEEIVPTLPMDKNEVIAFANAVFDRFKNPFIKHYLSSIALNSIAKFKVRVLPSILAYQEEKKESPKYLVFTMACLLEFYKGYWNEQTMPVQDDQEVITYIQQCWKLNTIQATVNALLRNDALWGEDLSQNKSLTSALEMALTLLHQKGVKEGLLTFLNSNIFIEK
jgi:tagaturonate reductase